MRAALLVFLLVGQASHIASAEEATVANLTREVDKLQEQRYEEAKEHEAKEDQLRDLAEKVGHFGWAYLLFSVSLAFGPTAAFMYKEDWAVGLTAASGSTDERPLLEDARAVRSAEAGEATGGADTCSDGQEFAEVPANAGAVDQAQPQRTMCNRILWGLRKFVLALMFSFTGLFVGSMGCAVFNKSLVPNIGEIATFVFSVVLSSAVGWSFGAVCEAAREPPSIEPRIPTEGSRPSSVVCLLRLAGTERRGCCTAWSCINACNIFAFSGLLLLIGMDGYTRWVEHGVEHGGELYYLFGNVSHVCHAISVLQHWVFAIILRKCCSPPPPRINVSLVVVRAVSLCGLASGADIFEGWLTSCYAGNVLSLSIVFNLSMLPSSLTCIILLEGELLPLMEGMDRLTSMKEAPVMECKELESHIRSINNRWSLFLGLHSVVGVVTFLAGTLSYFFGELVRHDGGYVEGPLASSVAPLFGMLFMQVASVASYNTKVYNLGKATDDHDLARLVNQERLNFKILGQTLDLPYFKMLAATCALSLTIAWVRSLHLVC